jgi:hypothetical protein
MDALLRPNTYSIEPITTILLLETEPNQGARKVEAEISVASIPSRREIINMNEDIARIFTIRDSLSRPSKARLPVKRPSNAHTARIRSSAT